MPHHGPHGPTIRRNVRDASAFVRWGGARQLDLPAGVLAPVNAGELMRGTTPTPSTWSVALTAEARDPQTGLVGVAVTVTFEITIGVGSASTVLRRTIVITAAAPSGDVQLILPAATIAVVALGAPSIAPPAAIAITTTALVCPFAPDSYQL